MEHVTVGQIVAAVALLAGLIGGLGVISRQIGKCAAKWLQHELSPIEKKLDNLNGHITEVDVSECKNFLVRFLADVEQGGHIDEIEKERFHEVYRHYEQDLHLNTYIHTKVVKLRKEGKL